MTPIMSEAKRLNDELNKALSMHLQTNREITALKQSIAAATEKGQDTLELNKELFRCEHQFGAQQDEIERLQEAHSQAAENVRAEQAIANALEREKEREVSKQVEVDDLER
jgi:predicted  nucleic acid-binding Zn-ribbon protein